MEKPKISAFVITFNEGEKIAACLESLSWVDEIVVVDDYSSDGTAEICERYEKVRLYRNKFTGFKDQKSFAVSLTSNDWLLELDADERVSEQMKDEIQAIPTIDFSAFNAFAFRRITNFWGKWIKHASMYPDYKTRLYNKQKGAWSEGNIHERFIPLGNTRKIHADIVHDQNLDLLAYLKRTARYSEMSASDMFVRGKRAKWHNFTIRPIYTFFYRYFARLGFLDGIQGFVIAVMGGIGTFVKYMTLYELQTGKRNLSQDSSQNASK
jgi:glycosyltransferase involved in cell wall biosynthesis